MNSYKILNASSVGRDSVLSGQLSEVRGHASTVPPAIVRYAYYAFIFSLPFESADIYIEELPLARLIGFILVAVTAAVKILHETRLRLELPGKAFWCFVAYLLVYAILGLNSILGLPENETLLTEMIIQGIKTFTQLLILFWISYNLLRYERITKGSLLVLAVACIIVAVLQVLGITDSITTQDRTAAFEANPNTIATVLCIGLLTLLGLAYGPLNVNLKTRLLFWLCSGIFGISIVITGSRGAMIALLLAMLVFFLSGKSLKSKFRAGLVVSLVIAVLGWLSYQVEPVRVRWEASYYEGDLASRDKLFDAAWEMFLEKPLIGWGPESIYELGFRVGLSRTREPHNIYLSLLTETGLASAIPFLLGLCFCFSAAWRAKVRSHGNLALTLLCFLIAIGMKSSWLTDKLAWIVLSYVLACGAHVGVPSTMRSLSFSNYRRRARSAAKRREFVP